MKDGEWVQMNATRSKDGVYDLLCFNRTTKLCGQIEKYEERLSQIEEESQSDDLPVAHVARDSYPDEWHYRHADARGEPPRAERSGDAVSDQGGRAERPSARAHQRHSGYVAYRSGQGRTENKVFSLHELGDRLYDMFAKNLDSRGIRYEVNMDSVTVDYVLGDELRISQVIINFLSNAVKFTSEGEIIVTFRQMMLQNGVVDMMIRVHDTGIGMEPEFINRIFRPFEQESVDTSKKYGGTGLGMAITDQIVKLMGGDIVVESQPGKRLGFLGLSAPSGG